MANFPSFQNVFNAILNTIQRYTLETIATITGSTFAIFLISKEYGDPNTVFYNKALLSSLLCLVAFLSVSLYSYASKKGDLFRLIVSLLIGALATVFVYSFEDDISEVEAQQFLVLNIALHLLVSFAGFIPKKYQQEEFWEFNKQLFLRIITAGLYSGVLFAGLALAIVAVKELFQLDLDEKVFGYLFVVIAGPFNTLFFLNGVPDIQNSKNTLTLSYPIALKKFTQYVLLPLISLYLLILLCYETKIIITMSLPVGWVSYLVLVFAIIGILSFLLVHPIANQKENLWMHSFNRWFYYLLIPLLGLLYWAILFRIYKYGFTHERYYVLLLSFWLTIVIAYFLIAQLPKIKFIPISLCVVGLLSIIGPQSADAISKKSQLNRFETYTKLLEKQKLNFEQEKDLSSIVDFLDTNYSAAIMLPIAKKNLSSLFENKKQPNSNAIMEALGATYRYKNDEKDTIETRFNYILNENYNSTIENIQGYDLSFLLFDYRNLECIECITIESKSYSIQSIRKPYGVDLKINNELVKLPFLTFIEHNRAFNNQGHSEKITQMIQTPKYSILITFLEANGSIQSKKNIALNYRLRILVKIK